MSTNQSLYDKRWVVTLSYETEHGVVDIEHHIEEIAELDSLIERGPHWYTFRGATIDYNPRRRKWNAVLSETGQVRPLA